MIRAKEYMFRASESIGCHQHTWCVLICTRQHTV